MEGKTRTLECIGRLADALQRRFPRLPREEAWQYAAEALLAACKFEEAASASVLQAKKDGWDDPLVFLRDREDEEGHRAPWETSLGDAGDGAARIEARAALCFPSHEGERKSRGRHCETRHLASLVREAIQALPPAHQQVMWARWGTLLAGKKPASYRAAAKAAGVSLGGAWNIERQALDVLRRLIADRSAIGRRKPVQTSWLDSHGVIKK